MHWSRMMSFPVMTVLFYTVKMVFDCLTNFAGRFGHICLYHRNGSIFLSASVSPFTSNFTGFRFLLGTWMSIFVVISVRSFDLFITWNFSLSESLLLISLSTACIFYCISFGDILACVGALFLVFSFFSLHLHAPA